MTIIDPPTWMMLERTAFSASTRSLPTSPAAASVNNRSGLKNEIKMDTRNRPKTATPMPHSHARLAMFDVSRRIRSYDCPRPIRNETTLVRTACSGLGI